MNMPRAAMWYDMMQDLSRILATPRPITDIQLRSQDFASMGSWIAAGLGLGPAFASALDILRNSQKSFAMENDQVLLDAAIEYAQNAKDASTTYKLPQKLYSEMEYWYGRKGDMAQFSKKYRNPTILSNKLNAAQDALSQNLSIQSYEDEFGRRTWKITLKEQQQP